MTSTVSFLDTTALADPGAAADAAVSAILDATVRPAPGAPRGVVVDSPPGAGKSTLVVRAAQELVGSGERLMIVAQTNSQVDDLVDRLAQKAPDMTIGRLHGADALPAAEALRHPNVTASGKPADLLGLDVVVATAAKWQWVRDVEPWRHAIVDEAYQMRSDALLAVARLFERALFVGDPGQLDPFTVVGTEQWSGLSHDPSNSAVVTLLAHNPAIQPHRLPVSWRLPATAAPLISEAFYPYTPFRAGTGPGDRLLVPAARADGSAVDAAIDEAAEYGWSLLELPARHTVRTDPQAVAVVAATVRRLLERSLTASSEQGHRPLTADRIAVGTAHRDQAAAVRAALASLGIPVDGTAGQAVTVDTANRLQGREYDVTVVLHPLSGRHDATAFHLETGRLCVLASRHRHACIVVARAGIPELLDEHPATDPVQLGSAVRIPQGWESRIGREVVPLLERVGAQFPDGWEANHRVLAELVEHRVRL
ncbi:AAA family ATPase [Kitasatospora viridis]|uniref:AAA domain-containing protein n=1 Tax=Kitasatospora viridis TaxID=281105 RepID=A0A561UKI9_9ACTN|nr:AAA family ATPase [Kitasatospora viridis]TWF99880.1 AAA domain-containing protein [Kitasatospora viridis]